MNGSPDIREMLEEWPMDPAREVRLVRGDDGREILQVRIPLGLQQCETSGRPDGWRPHGKESLLDYYCNRLASRLSRGKKRDVRLDLLECCELANEAALYHQRSCWFWQLGDWYRAARDARHILRMLDLVNRYAFDCGECLGLERWRPYFLRREAEASARHELALKHYDAALDKVETACQYLENLPPSFERRVQSERKKAIAALRKLKTQIGKKRPVSELERLERKLQTAIKNQAFERAAVLRDRIRTLREGGGSSANSTPLLPGLF